MTKNILLTGGRAPATLDLARCLARAGHRVSIAESFPQHLSRHSRSIGATFHLPPPRDDPNAYIDALTRIAREHKVDLLIPTCEEIFWIAGGLSRLTECCGIFCEDLSRLQVLHSKWDFFRLADSYGLPVPATRLLPDSHTAREDLLKWQAEHELKGFVLKPVFSRFASRAALFRNGIDADTALPEFGDKQWVAQEFLDGPAFCTYSVARRGQLLAYAAYRVVFQVGIGATVCFVADEHGGCRQWVEQFVARREFTGQIAFDFIEKNGQVLALECNPRLTSGIHLLSRAVGLPDCFCGEPTGVVTPPRQRPAVLFVPLLFSGAASIRSVGQAAGWLKKCLIGKDVVFRWLDPMPAIYQLISLFHFWRISRRAGVSLTEATTHDIEWNGVGLETPRSTATQRGARRS